MHSGGRVSQVLSSVLDMKQFTLMDGLFIFIFSAASTKLLHDTFAVTLLFEAIVFSCLIAGAIKILEMRLKHQSWGCMRQESSRVALAVLLTFNILFFSLMMVDRSKSLYVVRWVGDCSGLSEEEILIKVDTELGQRDDRYLERRFDEQVERKVIRVKDDKKLELSSIGKSVYWLGNTISKVFGLRGWSQNSLEDSAPC